MDCAPFRNRSYERRGLCLDKTLHPRESQFQDLRHFRTAKTPRCECKHSYSMLQDRVLLKSSPTHVVVASQEGPTLFAEFWKKYRVSCSSRKIIEVLLVANPRFLQDLMQFGAVAKILVEVENESIKPQPLSFPTVSLPRFRSLCGHILERARKLSLRLYAYLQGQR